MSPLLNGEQLGPITAVKLLEAVHGNPGCACDKLQQPGSRLIVERVNSLYKHTEISHCANGSFFLNHLIINS